MADTLQQPLLCGSGGPNSTLDRVLIDNACIQLEQNNNRDRYQVLTQNYECWGCPMEETWSSPSFVPDGNFLNISNSFQVQTRYSTILEVVKNSKIVCNASQHFQQFGVYHLNLDNCEISVLSAPVNAFLPILWAFWALCFLAGLRLVLMCVYNTLVFNKVLVNEVILNKQ